MFRALEVMRQGISVESALEKIVKALPSPIQDNHLIIIDKYFLHVEEAEAEEYSKAFFDWLIKNRIRDFKIYSKRYSKRNYSFESLLQATCPVQIVCQFENAIKSNHDRFWFFSPDYHNYQVAVPGISFNGFGKQLSTVNPLPEKDIKEILMEFNFIPCNNQSQ